MSSSRLYEIVLHELPAHLTDLVYRFCWIIAFSIGLFVVWKFSVSLFKAGLKYFEIADRQILFQLKHPFLFILLQFLTWAIILSTILWRLVGGKPFAVRLCDKMTRGMRSLEYFTTHQVPEDKVPRIKRILCQNTEDIIPRILKTLFQV